MAKERPAEGSGYGDLSMTEVVEHLVRAGPTAPDGGGRKGQLPADQMPAGHPPPAQHSFDDVGIAHAIDGDGSALCQAELLLSPVDDYGWDDIPPDQRCPVCALVINR